MIRTILIAALVLVPHVGSADEELFRKQVAPLLAFRCIRCHNENNKQGGLSLQTKESALAGGQSGNVIEPGDVESSYLAFMITPDEGGEADMPQGGKPLKRAEVAAVKKWIAAGARWPDGLRLEEPVWWSLQKLERPAIPELPRQRRTWVRNPIDAFIAKEHARLQLTPAPEADRRTLIRRLYFDLIGLPPTPEEVDAFLADGDPRAYEKLVDWLLDSPHYGERWARHWLDVVHYGETHGYDKDKPRENAWPYRDYVIRSLNADKPYGRFVAEQVAGDVLYPETADGFEALGFLAAGPWDFIGHVEVPDTKIDGKIARHLDRDDFVRTTIMTFCSLTVGCAQCHDHKFDPITQKEYYQLQSVFAAIDRADKTYDRDPEVHRRRTGLLAQQRKLTSRRDELTARIAKLGGEELKALDRQLAELRDQKRTLAPQYGYHSAIAQTPDVAKWVQVDLGKTVPMARVEYAPCYDDFNGIGAGFGFPSRYKIEASTDASFAKDVHLLVDATDKDVPNPGTTLQSATTEGVTARYVRVTATKLAHRKNDYIFALAELRVLDADGNNLAAGNLVTALDSIEAPVRWAKKNLVDGIFPGPPVPADEIAELERERETLIKHTVDAKTRNALSSTSKQLAKVRSQLESLPEPQRVYAGAVYHGSGNFRGTGPDGGEPRAIHVLERGNVQRPGSEVAPGTLDCIEGLDGRFDVEPAAPEGARRAALARWLSDPRNALTWRSIVNRVWQYHFGRGLVATPNDFGRMGQQPTHPELLDWLAVEFRDGGRSLKSLHRLIVTSATYRQASTSPEAVRAAEIDADNRSLWRMNRRRLEAEVIRDAMLAVAGKLNRKMGGSSFRDFVIEKPQHSPHYRYELHDPEDPRSHRRSIYRFLVRSQTQPFMTVMDCADPSMMVARRNETISPLQALALLNNKLSLVMARHFATRVEKLGASDRRRVKAAFRLALSRKPSPEELTALTDYARQHGLPNTCRLLFNLNEFIYVD